MFLKYLILIICLIFYQNYSYALEVCELNFISKQKHLEDFMERAKNINSEFSDLYISPKNVGKVKSIKTDLEGNVNAGVFSYKVSPKSKSSFLKFLPSNIDFNNYKFKLLLQDHFAKMGLAPKITGVLRKDSINSLRSSSNIDLSKFVKLGYSMEKLPEGVVIKDLVVNAKATYHELYPKPLEFLSNDKIEEAVNKIKYIEKVFNDLEVIADDVQFYITKKGDLYLIDFDFYEWSIDALKRKNNFKEADFSRSIDFIRSFSKN